MARLCFQVLSSRAPTTTAAVVVTCTARSSRKPRRKLSASARKRRASSHSSSNDRDTPISDDNIDTTDITTYVSCPTCFNSLMIRPELLQHGPLDVHCNCCGRSTTARMADMENVDGTEFNYLAWRKEYLKSKLPENAEENLPPYIPRKGAI